MSITQIKLVGEPRCIKDAVTLLSEAQVVAGDVSFFGGQNFRTIDPSLALGMAGVILSAVGTADVLWRLIRRIWGRSPSVQISIMVNCSWIEIESSDAGRRLVEEASGKEVEDVEGIRRVSGC